MNPLTEAPIEFEQIAKKVKVVTNRLPDSVILLDDNIPLHAARLLLLIKIAGRPAENPAIDGRTKLAKLDFFVRYPMFLMRAREILLPNDRASDTLDLIGSREIVETPMIRYKYGPWDKKYYTVFSYLSSKNLIEISGVAGVDRFSLTLRGTELSRKLQTAEEFHDLCIICEIAGNMFGHYKGSEIKNFIYRHYPEVVKTQYTKIILPGFIEDED